MKGFKRLGLAGINYFEFLPESEHQVILGTNGAGKSAVMNQLSPLPAVKADFHPEGYKRIRFTHLNHHYELFSGFEGSKFTNSFKKNEKELNDGGTNPAQLELVRQEFGITPELWSMLCGETRYTAMTSTQRREWFTKMGGGDMRFALKVYMATKKRLSRSKTLSKHYQERITQETASLMDETELQTLRDICTQTKEELMFLIENKEAGLPDRDAVEARVMTLSDELKAKFKETIGLRLPPLTSVNVTSAEELKIRMAQIEGQISSQVDRQHDLETEYAKVKEVVASLKDANVESVEALSESVEALRQQRDALYAPLTYFESGETDLSSIIAHGESLVPGLLVKLNSLPDNTTERFTRIKMQHAVEQIPLLAQTIAGLDKRIGKAEHQLEHATKTPNVECPKCQFVFKPGLHMPADKIEAALKQLMTQRQTAANDLDTAERYLESYQEYVTAYKEVATHVSPQVQSLYQIVKDFSPTTQSVTTLQSMVRTYMGEITVLKTIRDLNRQIETNENALLHAEELFTKDSDYAEGNMGSLKNQIEELRDTVAHHQSTLDQLGNVDRLAQRISSNQQVCLDLSSRLKQGMDTMVRIIRQDIINKRVSERQSELAARETELGNEANKIKSLESLNQQLVTAGEQSKVYHLLEQNLSPVDGIIAEQSRLLIDGFLNDVNKVIGQVWTHGLEIMSSPVDNDDITYKFPLNVSDGALITPDISRCSSGQRDVIDFAFRLVTCWYLGLTQYPLYVDELAPTLDETHRNNMMAFVKTYVESNHCTQLFMISHYASMHGVFPYAEYCVLDESNILNMPSTYNQHVVIN